MTRPRGGAAPAARAASGGPLSADVNALRLAGVFLLWLGCRAQRVWWMPAGAAIILLGWWLAWQRGAPAPASQRS